MGGLGSHPVMRLVSSPGEFHPQALSEPDLRLSPHPAPIIQPPRALFCPLVPPLLPRLTAVQNRTIQSLRSMPITGTSSLLRIVPPLHIASILSSLRGYRLEFSLNINVQVPKFHRKACARFLPAIYRSPVWSVNRVSSRLFPG
jgi:hypothetical protein